MHSINIFERTLLSNLNKLRQISIVDGENFRFLPYSVKSDFLQYYSQQSTLFFVSKSPKPQEYLKNIKNVYFFKLSLYDDNLKKNKKYCFDDSFCIYIANLLNENKKDFKLFTNDKFNDFGYIKKQDNSILDFFQSKYIFDPKNKLRNIDIDLIKDNKVNFY